MNLPAALFALRDPDGVRVGGYVVRLAMSFQDVKVEYGSGEEAGTVTVSFDPPAYVDPDKALLRERGDLADGRLLRFVLRKGASTGTAYVEKRVAVFNPTVEAVEFEVPS